MSFSGRRPIRSSFGALYGQISCRLTSSAVSSDSVSSGKKSTRSSVRFSACRAHSEPGNLKYRDAGDTVVGKLHFSLFRQNLLIFNQKRNLRAHPNTRPGGKLVSFAAERAEVRENGIEAS